MKGIIGEKPGGASIVIIKRICYLQPIEFIVTNAIGGIRTSSFMSSCTTF
jgi:hypothetical protein